jgi:amino acid transporter
VNAIFKRRRKQVGTVLLALAGVAALFCFLRLADLIAALIVIRIVLQFLVQSIGVIVLRIRRPDLPRPFRMWLYPLPALLAAASFIFILISRRNFQRHSDSRNRDLHGASVAARRVAVWGSVAGRWSLVVRGSVVAGQSPV